MFILRRACDEKVRISIITDCGSYFPGYIIDIGEDYVKCKRSLKKKCDDVFIKLEKIEKISTSWEE